MKAIKNWLLRFPVIQTPGRENLLSDVSNVKPRVSNGSILHGHLVLIYWVILFTFCQCHIYWGTNFTCWYVRGMFFFHFACRHAQKILAIEEFFFLMCADTIFSWVCLQCERKRTFSDITGIFVCCCDLLKESHLGMEHVTNSASCRLRQCVGPSVNSFSGLSLRRIDFTAQPACGLFCGREAGFSEQWRRDTHQLSDSQKRTSTMTFRVQLRVVLWLSRSEWTNAHTLLSTCQERWERCWVSTDQNDKRENWHQPAPWFSQEKYPVFTEWMWRCWHLAFLSGVLLQRRGEEGYGWPCCDPVCWVSYYHLICTNNRDGFLCISPLIGEMWIIFNWSSTLA